MGKDVEVVEIGRQAVKHAAPVADFERDFDALVALHEGREQVRREIFASGPDAQAQAAGVQSAQILEAVFHVLDRAENRQAGFVEKVAGFCAVNAFADLFEKREADGFAELANLSRNGRLRHVQFFGGAGETSEAGAGLKDGELRE